MDCRISTIWDKGHLPTHLLENKQKVEGFCWLFLCLISFSRSPDSITEASSSTGYYKTCGLLLQTSGCTSTPPKFMFVEIGSSHIYIKSFHSIPPNKCQFIQHAIQGKEISRSTSKQIFASILLPFHKWRSRAVRTFSWYREKQKPKWDGCSKGSSCPSTERDGYTPRYIHLSSYFPRPCQTVNCISQQRFENCLRLTHRKTQQNGFDEESFPLVLKWVDKDRLQLSKNYHFQLSPIWVYTWIVNLI